MQSQWRLSQWWMTSKKFTQTWPSNFWWSPTPNILERNFHWPSSSFFLMTSCPLEVLGKNQNILKSNIQVVLCFLLFVPEREINHNSLCRWNLALWSFSQRFRVLFPRAYHMAGIAGVKQGRLWPFYPLRALFHHQLGPSSSEKHCSICEFFPWLHFALVSWISLVFFFFFFFFFPFSFFFFPFFFFLFPFSFFLFPFSFSSFKEWNPNSPSREGNFIKNRFTLDSNLLLLSPEYLDQDFYLYLGVTPSSENQGPVPDENEVEIPQEDEEELVLPEMESDHSDEEEDDYFFLDEDDFLFRLVFFYFFSFLSSSFLCFLLFSFPVVFAVVSISGSSRFLSFSLSLPFQFRACSRVISGRFWRKSFQNCELPLCLLAACPSPCSRSPSFAVERTFTSCSVNSLSFLTTFKTMSSSSSLTSNFCLYDRQKSTLG